MNKNVSVLVVDDSPTIRKILTTCMKNESYNVDEAINGEEAITLAKDKKYNLILLDVVMPGINGFEACKIIKQEGKSKNTPVIFISAEESDDFNLKGHNVGSVDYLIKPINMKQLSLKSAVHIKNSQLLQELEQYKNRMQMDIKKASSFYHAFLPTKNEAKLVEENYNVNIGSYFLPFNEIGGDFWKIIPINTHKFGILVVDFSGHGTTSALNVSYLNAVLSHKIIWEDPIQVMGFINKHLTSALQTGSFATAIYLIFNKKTNLIEYVNCASPYPLLTNKNGKKIKYYEKSTKPLGIWPSNEMDMATEEIKLSDGDTLFIYSDVLLESKHTPKGDRWMMDGLKNTVESLKNYPPKDKLKKLKELFLETSHKPLSDDLTLISINLKDK